MSPVFYLQRAVFEMELAELRNIEARAQADDAHREALRAGSIDIPAEDVRDIDITRERQRKLLVPRPE